jgi:hypothetical protein
MLTENAQRYTFLLHSFDPPSGSHRQRRAAQSERPCSNVSAPLRRSVRIERKAELARQLLDAVAGRARDRRCRLLSIAVLRADETVVDGILASLRRDADPNSERPERKQGEPQRCARIVA